jgi:hypothetical protein
MSSIQCFQDLSVNFMRTGDFSVVRSNKRCMKIGTEPPRPNVKSNIFYAIVRERRQCVREKRFSDADMIIDSSIIFVISRNRKIIFFMFSRLRFTLRRRFSRWRSGTRMKIALARIYFNSTLILARRIEVRIFF